MGCPFSIPILFGGAVKQDEKQSLTHDMAQTTSNGDKATITERKIYQPLHPSVRHLLDPDYVSFHDTYAQYVEPEQLLPWSPALRTRYTWPYAGSPVVEVGSVRDMRPCPNFDIRVFTPSETSPKNGWPVMIWFHGGGFAGGNIDSDNDLCSLACRDVGCVVVNVDYRLAPENPYPAAVEDTLEILKYISSDAGVAKLSIDRTKIAIGGSSAGGNLAAVGALLAVEHSIPISLQALVVPVTDNTATLETIWSEHPNAPWLTGPRMTWYRNLYLRNEIQAKEWQASPTFAPQELLSRLPKTWIAIAAQDMLSTEGLAYAKMLTDLGVETHVEVYEGMPHGMMALSGALRTGRRAMQDLIQALRTTFHDEQWDLTRQN